MTQEEARVEGSQLERALADPFFGCVFVRALSARTANSTSPWRRLFASERPATATAVPAYLTTIVYGDFYLLLCACVCALRWECSFPQFLAPMHLLRWEYVRYWILWRTVQPHLPGMELLPGPGDRGVHFKCSRCGGGQQVFRHAEKTWLEITLTSLYNLELQDRLVEGRRFFHVRQEICSFADRNWDVICLGRTRTPTWWATLNAQITTRTDLFETSKHGSGNWALRHSNISHPIVYAPEAVLMDAAKECPPEKPATIKLNATAIVSKKVIGDRRFFLVTLENFTGTVWRESTHPCFKNGELVRKFSKTESSSSKDSPSSGSMSSSNGSSGSHSPNSGTPGGSKSKSGGSGGNGRSRAKPSAAAYANNYSTATPLGVTLGVFTEKVVKTPSRLSRRQQSKHDAALAAANAAVNSSPSTSASGTPTTQKNISPMAESYRKTAKIAAGHIDHTMYSASPSTRSTTNQAQQQQQQQQHQMHHQNQHQHPHQHQMMHHGMHTTSSSNNSRYSSPSGAGMMPNGSVITGAAYMNAAVAAAAAAGGKGAPMVMTKLPNGQLVNAMQLKLAQSPQPMRCHQCNRRQLSRPKPGQEFVFCTHTMSKIQGDMTLNVACTQSYCRTCIDLIYHEHPLEDEHETSTWICPACRKICTCATCNDYVDPTGQAPPCNMVVTSSMPTAQLQQYQQQLQQQQQQYAKGNTATNSIGVNSSSSSITTQSYEGSESPIGEDASSTTSVGTTYAASSAKSTPSGSVSLSPNASLWATSTGSAVTSLASANGVPLNANSSQKWAGNDRPKSAKDMSNQSVLISSRSSSKFETHQQQHAEFDSNLKILIPTTYDSAGAPNNTSAKNTKTAPSPSPHNTRSNSGTRTSQHPLSLYTQSLVSRGPSNRRKSTPAPSSHANTSSASAGGEAGAGASRAGHPTLDQMPYMLNGGEHSWRSSSSSATSKSTKSTRNSRTTTVTHHQHQGAHDGLTVSTTNPLMMAYAPLASPTGDVFGSHSLPMQAMPMSKGKRPYHGLSTSSAGDLQRSRRNHLMDSFEPASKRRSMTSAGALDDMADLFGSGDLTSPRQLLSAGFGTEDDTPSGHNVGGSNGPRVSGTGDDDEDDVVPNGGHSSSAVVSTHHLVTLDDSIAKEVIATDALVVGGGNSADDHLLHSHAAHAPPSINPAHMMMNEFFDGDSDDIAAEGWSEAPISASGYEETASYF